MKNLWSKIAALIISLALSQNIKAQELDSLDKKYFLKIEIGQYIFYENWLGKLMQFGLENETSLTKNTGLNFGIESFHFLNKIAKIYRANFHKRYTAQFQFLKNIFYLMNLIPEL